MPELTRDLQVLADDATAEMRAQDVAPEQTRVLRKVHVRYEGTDSALIVDFADCAAMIADFEEAHRQRYGFVMEEKAHLVEAISVEVIGATEAVEDPVLTVVEREKSLVPATHVQMYARDTWLKTPVYVRESLQPGDEIDGPSIIIEPTSTNTPSQPSIPKTSTDGKTLGIIEMSPPEKLRNKTIIATAMKRKAVMKLRNRSSRTCCCDFCTMGILPVMIVASTGTIGDSLDSMYRLISRLSSS